MGYFSKEDFQDHSFFHLPKGLLLAEKYKDLSADAKLVWSILYDLQVYFYKIGWVEEESGKIYFYHPQRFLDHVNKEDSVMGMNLLKELHHFQLIDYSSSDVPKLLKYYLIKPDVNERELGAKYHEQQENLIIKMNDYIASLSEKEPEELSPEIVRKKNGDLLKTFIRNNHLQHDDLVSELYTICIMQNPKKLITMDYISEAYQNIVNTAALTERTKPASRTVEDVYSEEQIEALNYMKNSQRVFDLSLIQTYFNDETLIILHKHFDLAEYLVYMNKLSLSILSNLRTYMKLNMERFNLLLDQAFSLYDHDDEELLDFHAFFEKIVENQGIFERERKLKDEIKNKLFALPEQLKDFTYKELKKALEHFPERYDLIAKNLRVINTVYQEQEEAIQDSVYEKAFRRLFMKEQDIYSVHSYFKNAIKWIQDEEKGIKTSKSSKPEKPIEKELKKNYSKEEWLSKIVNVKDTDGAIEKMSEKEREEYFKKAAELERQLQELESGKD